MKESKYKSWLWPARIIRLRESARLRQEHNQLLNSHAELLEALESLVVQLGSQPAGSTLADYCDNARQAIAKAMR